MGKVRAQRFEIRDQCPAALKDTHRQHTTPGARPKDTPTRHNFPTTIITGHDHLHVLDRVCNMLCIPDLNLSYARGNHPLSINSKISQTAALASQQHKISSGYGNPR